MNRPTFKGRSAAPLYVPGVLFRADGDGTGLAGPVSSAADVVRHVSRKVCQLMGCIRMSGSSERSFSMTVYLKSLQQLTINGISG